MQTLKIYPKSHTKLTCFMQMIDFLAENVENCLFWSHCYITNICTKCFITVHPNKKQLGVNHKTWWWLFQIIAAYQNILPICLIFWPKHWPDKINISAFLYVIRLSDFCSGLKGRRPFWLLNSRLRKVPSLIRLSISQRSLLSQTS